MVTFSEGISSQAPVLQGKLLFGRITRSGETAPHGVVSGTGHENQERKQILLGGVERGQESQHKENHALNLLWGQEQHGIYPWLKFGPSRLLLFFSLSKMWGWGLGPSRCLWCLQGTSSSADKGKGRWKLRLLSSMIFGEAKIIKCCCQRTLRLSEGREGGVSLCRAPRVGVSGQTQWVFSEAMCTVHVIVTET